jgi:hypothetical protein
VTYDGYGGGRQPVAQPVVNDRFGNMSGFTNSLRPSADQFVLERGLGIIENPRASAAPDNVAVAFKGGGQRVWCVRPQGGSKPFVPPLMVVKRLAQHGVEGCALPRDSRCELLDELR